MADRKDDPPPRLDREARNRIGKALRADMPVTEAPIPADHAELLARLQRNERERRRP
ncbi:hypothetical protein [Salinarimonas soli]|uniref:hypothetical protein n=1 Tax=Salinarimonas soli TaxID=1638099 RepID=UPI001661D4FE|nr:hypothetical protein [Salinarimonas soli]